MGILYTHWLLWHSIGTTFLYHLHTLFCIWAIHQSSLSLRLTSFVPRVLIGAIICYYNTKLMIISTLEIPELFVRDPQPSPARKAPSLPSYDCMFIYSCLTRASFCHFSTVSSDKLYSFIFYKDTSNDWFYLSPLIYILQIYSPSITYYYTVLRTSNVGKKNIT